MPNIATVLKAEIVRLARKELREQVDPLRKSLSASRAEVAALKRKVSDLERQIRHASRVLPESRLRSSEHATAWDKWIGCGLIFLSSGPCQAAGGGPG